MNNSPQLYIFSPNIQLEYMIYGHGKKSLICFHGFGQDYLVFENFSFEIENYQVISVNLFFHGRSDRVKGAKYMTHKEWKKILNGFLNELNIDRFSILGYSMGGRYVTSTINSFSDRIDHCIFMAPDGIVKRRSFEFATFPLGPQQMFRFFMNNPQPFFIFLNIIEKTRLMNPWTIKFSKSQLKDEEQRLRVLKCWITLKHLRLKQTDLVHLINQAKFKTHLIFGKYDRIIIPEKHQSFFDRLNSASISIIESPHHELIDLSLPTIKKFLLQESK